MDALAILDHFVDDETKLDHVKAYYARARVPGGMFSPGRRPGARPPGGDSASGSHRGAAGLRRPAERAWARS